MEPPNKSGETMTKRKKITSYYLPNKKEKNSSGDNVQNVQPAANHVESESANATAEEQEGEQSVPNSQFHAQGDYLNCLVRDPGLRRPIDSYDVNDQGFVSRAYIKLGAYQPKLDKKNYPPSGPIGHMRRFQKRWYKKFRWLEYSPTNDAAYCFYCFLFPNNPIGRGGSETFSISGFKNWKRVGGKDCVFFTHMGKDANSAHGFATKCFNNLKNPLCHIDKILEKQGADDICRNRLRLKTSIDAIRWLTFQSCAYRGHDESAQSENKGNFLEMINLLASYNKDVNAVVLDKAPQNAKYTSPDIQKEILQVFGRMVQREIREEIGNAKFCLIVDESRDIAKREQMAIVLRFVDKHGFVCERFLDIVHVQDTTSLTLKNAICVVLSHHKLSVKNIRGQGYDRASNMRGEWNGLQALFAKDCSYAYYVHCLAHQLQLALVGAAREVPDIHTFFQHLVFVVNAVTNSSKRHDQLQAYQVAEFEHLMEIEELVTGKGVNQIGTLQRPGDTRWSSHFTSICSLLRMYGATLSVLSDLATGGVNYSQRGDALNSIKMLMSFEFVFILHLIKDILGITNALCQALQLKSQDIVNAMHLVSTTKISIQNMRESGWESLLEKVKLFCERHNVTVPDMDAPYVDILKSIRQQGRRKQTVTMAHHYRVEIFTAAIDQQLKELNSRFSEQATDLLILSATLSPRDGYKSFKADDICNLVSKYYPVDFSEQDRMHLEYELQHYILDVPNHPDLKNLSTIGDLCRGIVSTGKSDIYPLIDRLLRLLLTLPVSSATSERAFSAMKIVKTDLRNRMGNEFMRDCLLVYIEKEIAKKFSVDSIIDDFYLMKSRRVQLK